MDAWLERRLRVFERALAQLEQRQEKAERALEQFMRQQDMAESALAAQLAQIEAQLAVLSTAKATMLPESATAVPAAEAPLESLPHPVTDDTAAEPSPETEATAPDAESLVLPPWTPDAPPPDEKAMAEFVANARQAIREAAGAAPAAPRRRKRVSRRLMALAGGLCLLVLACAGILLGNVAGATQVEASAGVAHRQGVRGLARVMAMADGGDAVAETVLALDYLYGKGVAADRDAARRWSLAAARQHYPLAQYVLGMTLLEGGAREEAAHWFRAAAEQGNVKAMHNLAVASLEGQGMSRNAEEAVRWFTRAATEGYRDSAFDLGVLYERGEGVPQDARAALKWYLVAARTGDTQSAARAAYLFGQMHAADAAEATKEAAAFVAAPASPFANQAPVL